MTPARWLHRAERRIALSLIIDPRRMRRVLSVRGWTPNAVIDLEAAAIAWTGWLSAAREPSIMRDRAHTAARLDFIAAIGPDYDPILCRFAGDRIFEQAHRLMFIGGDYADAVTPLVRPSLIVGDKLRQAENLRRLCVAREREAYHVIAEGFTDEQQADLPHQPVRRPVLNVASDARDVPAAGRLGTVERAAAVPRHDHHGQLQRVGHDGRSGKRLDPGHPTASDGRRLQAQNKVA